MTVCGERRSGLSTASRKLSIVPRTNCDSCKSLTEAVFTLIASIDALFKTERAPFCRTCRWWNLAELQCLSVTDVHRRYSYKTPEYDWKSCLVCNGQNYDRQNQDGGWVNRKVIAADRWWVQVSQWKKMENQTRMVTHCVSQKGYLQILCRNPREHQAKSWNVDNKFANVEQNMHIGLSAKNDSTNGECPEKTEPAVQKIIQKILSAVVTRRRNSAVHDKQY